MSSILNTTEKTSLADEFLADFDEEEQSEDLKQEENNVSQETHDKIGINKQNLDSILQLGQDESKTTGLKVEQDLLAQHVSKDILPDFKFATKLEPHMKQIEKYMQREGITSSNLEDDPEYQCIIDSNRIITEIEDEIVKFHAHIRTLYAKKFPDLESHVLNALDYARVVKRIGNLDDISGIDMTDILPSAINMVVKVTFATTQKTKLTDEETKRVLEACDEVLKLDEMKKKILDYVASRMSAVAPNLSRIVGTTIAAQLIGIAGGLTPLSNLPASVVQTLGKQKRILAGLSAKTTIRHIGFIGDCEIVKNSPPSLQSRVGRLVSTKCILAARADAFNSAKDGSIGQLFRDKIEDTIRKWQTPPPAKQEKPLPAPDDKPKKRRGGKKARRLKERYRITEMMKKKNRIGFGVPQYEDYETGEEYGLLGTGQSGSLRLKAQTKVKKKEWTDPRKPKHQQQYGGLSAIDGFSTSLIFTPVQGLELNVVQQKKQEETKKYFDHSKFFKVGEKRERKEDESESSKKQKT